MGNEQAIQDFVREYTIVHNIKEKRAYKYRLFLGKLDRWLGKPFNQATKQDLLKVYDKLRNSKDLKDWSKDDFVKIIKTFGKSQGWDVVWMKANFSKNSGLLASQLLTQEEILAMASAGNTMESTILLVMYELGIRITELRYIQLLHCEFNGSNYARVTIPISKTKTRTLPAIISAPYLKEWINKHPFRQNKSAYLFCKADPNKPISDTAIRKIFRKLAVRANIHKDIWPQLLRHSRASAMAAMGMNEALMKQMFGWAANSRTPATTYIHLASRDLDNYLLSSSGLVQIKQEIKDQQLMPRPCPRCSKENKPSDEICYNCNWPLTQKAILEMDEESKEVDNFVEKFRDKLKAMMMAYQKGEEII